MLADLQKATVDDLLVTGKTLGTWKDNTVKDLTE